MSTFESSAVRLLFSLISLGPGWSRAADRDRESSAFPSAAVERPAKYSKVTNPTQLVKDLSSRIGGEIPAFCDRIAARQRWRSNWLPFSNGRAALAWLLDRKPARAAALCAYTCPSLAAFFRRVNLPIGLFDIGASIDEILRVATDLPAPRVVLVPALFGTAPWLDTTALSLALDGSDVVVIDAAQTAFGHMDFPLPPRGAVLSCPRKTTSLPDGAVLAVGEEVDGLSAIASLAVALYPQAMQQAARALWATASIELEKEALRFHRLSEASWPNEPHRMSPESRVLLSHLDRDWHVRTRRANRASLISALRPDLPLWASAEGSPFSLPIFVDNRDELLNCLMDSRIFASALWPDAERDSRRHPIADWCARHLVSLPVDQRHDASDMQRIACVVNESARRPVSGWLTGLDPLISPQSRPAAAG